MHEVLIGESCFTASEQEKLLQRINEQSSAKVTHLTGQWLYYVDLKSAKDLARVKQLLQLSSDASTSAPAENTLGIHIFPRNISPWSSKATSIALVCGLDEVHRIERGRVVYLQFEGTNAAEKDLASFRDVLYDRMTEFFGLEPPVLTAMFAEGERNPLVVVDIFGDARGPLPALQEYNAKMGLGLDERKQHPALFTLRPASLNEKGEADSLSCSKYGVPGSRIQKAGAVSGMALDSSPRRVKF